MNILVLNCGSSSIKVAVIHPESGERLLEVSVERVTTRPTGKWNDGSIHAFSQPGHEGVLQELLPILTERLGQQAIHGVGHRVAHGGARFDRPVRLSPELVDELETLNDLAPLHNPMIMVGIRAGMAFFKDLIHVAVFDTAFHHTLPKRAYTYALPQWLSEKYQLRRFGFHGTSHEYVAQQAARYLQSDLREMRLITCHLGSGCSVAAIEYGRSVETSMGMTPLEGLVMGTRSGDIDPGLFYYLLKKGDFTLEQLNEWLNMESGLKGLSANSADMRDILEAASQGDDHARLAIQVFAHRVRKYIGAYATVMDGVDAIVFTGGIGENSHIIRHRIAQRLHFMGAILDEEANDAIRLDHQHPVGLLSAPNSRVHLMAVRTDEQLAIAQKTAALLEEADRVNTELTIPIAISARHVHLTQETVELLFGKGHQLTPFKPLSQPGHFAAAETVTLVGPKNRIEGVRVLGPCRPRDQVEISRTDEFFLGIDAPIRESGKLDNTPGIKLIGPEGEIQLKEGLICAWRHIHMSPEHAHQFGVRDKDVVDVAVDTGGLRDLVFGNVLIRVTEGSILEMHIDTDEGNAAEIDPGDTGALMPTQATGHLQKRRT